MFRQAYPEVKIQKNQSNSFLRDTDYEQIVKKIEEIDAKNKKLISIADNIMKTSFLKPAQTVPTIISELEEQMRSAFNSLIENIRQYFIGIDDKLKKLGIIIEQKFRFDREKDLTKSSDNQITQKGKYDNLFARISSLEENLKKTQQNEGKLISVIEQMMNKRNYEEEPTILKYVDTSQQKNKKHYQRYDSPKSILPKHENSFRLFSMKNEESGNLTDPRKIQYGNLIESRVQSGLNPKKRDEPSCFMRTVATQNPIRNVPILKRSLKGVNSQFQLDNSNRIHRLSYMMKVLKE